MKFEEQEMRIIGTISKGNCKSWKRKWNWKLEMEMETGNGRQQSPDKLICKIISELAGLPFHKVLFGLSCLSHTWLNSRSWWETVKASV